MVTPELIRTFSAEYPVNAAGIGSALDTVKALIPEENADPQAVREALGELLTRHQDLTCGEKRKAMGHPSELYDIRALNMDIEPAQILTSLRSFLNLQGKEAQEGSGMNLLFWGRPGTGKTEFAKFIASEMGLDLLIKRASDLLGPFVGQTEWNIKEAFDEAERQKAILLIDEADSFFIDRTNARHSWEISQANELLTEMENYRGILICCTNMLHNLDKAAMRRFSWKVEFRPLTEEGKVALFQRYFCPKEELTPEMKSRLRSIRTLTPGDIKAVWQRYRYLPEAERNLANLLSALEKEAVYKGEDKTERIGFYSQGAL
jgi:hypothetical protein